MQGWVCMDGDLGDIHRWYVWFLSMKNRRNVSECWMKIQKRKHVSECWMKILINFMFTEWNPKFNHLKPEHNMWNAFSHDLIEL